MGECYAFGPVISAKFIPLDSSVSGSQFGTSGSPLLAHFIRETAEGVPHPTVANKTLWDARSDSGLLTQPDSLGKSDDAVKIAQTELEVAIAMADDLGVSPLGSGSDYTVFLQRNGVSGWAYFSRTSLLMGRGRFQVPMKVSVRHFVILCTITTPSTTQSPGKKGMGILAFRDM